MKNESSIFKEMKMDAVKVQRFIKQQSSAPSITLMGPSGSGKSNLITSILAPEANKLLSKNIGVSAQTTVIPLQLMLNNRLKETELLIQCVKRHTSAFVDFKESVVNELAINFYEERDELDTFTISDKLVKAILNPVNRTFHAYDFAKNNQLIEALIIILEAVSKFIIKLPEILNSTADKLYKEKRATNKNIKKIDVYNILVDDRMSEYLKENHLNDLYSWFTDTLSRTIQLQADNFWTFPSINSLLADIENDATAANLMEFLYGDDSACSLIYEEVKFATCSSQKMQKTYIENNDCYVNRTIKLNILDTVGLTQTSHEKEIISDNMDQILDRKSDAIIFLCSAEEKPIVYETCIKLLHEKKNKLSAKPVVICRTKADLVIRNIATKEYHMEIGKNDFTPDNELYGVYIKRAYDEFLKTFIQGLRFDENTIGVSSENRKIEYISLAQDISSLMKSHLKDALDIDNAYKLFYDLANQVDLLLNCGKPRLWLESMSLEELPLNVMFEGVEPLSNTIAMAMIAKDHQNGSQYKNYIKKSETYHGRSVNCFRTKLSYGDGHETNANYYDNFKLFIPNMVYKWLKEVSPKDDILSHVKISFDYLETKLANEKRTELINDFSNNLNEKWDSMIWRLAKNLSYYCQKEDFEKAFINGSWSDCFRKSLKIIDANFIKKDYWQTNILSEFQKVAQEILQTMYVFD